MTSTGVPRGDPAWYLPPRLPGAFAERAAPVTGGLDVGAAGKVGVLDVALAPHSGITRIERRYQRAPLHLYRPIYLDPHQPGMAFLYLQQSGDGMVQGDRYRVDISCAPGSRAHVTTQAATKVYGATHDYVTQIVNLHAGPGAVLEYLPDPVVPFRGSRLFARTCVTADPDATVVLGDVLLPGRVAHGEAHAYDLYWSETEFRRPDGTLFCRDVLRLSPGDGDDPRTIGLLGGQDVVATLYVLTGALPPPSLVSLLRSALGACPAVLAGATELPDRSGAAVRILGTSSAAVRAALTSAWGAARRWILGAPPPDMRKG